MIVNCISQSTNLMKSQIEIEVSVDISELPNHTINMVSKKNELSCKQISEK